MIITRTPFRISFFGGGTDYPTWFQERGGAVLSTSFDKYCYISCRELPPFFDHKYRIAYSKLENAKTIDDIEHPAVRAVLREIGLEQGLEIHCDADLPARSGLGSSSSFIVGLLNTLIAFQGKRVSHQWLAKEAIRIEQTVLNETVGSQDQVAAAYGGLNVIRFLPHAHVSTSTANGMTETDWNVQVEPVLLPHMRKQELNNHLMLFFTGFSRIASEIAKSQVASFAKKENDLLRMGEMVEEALGILDSDKDIRCFGELLHNAWTYKRGLSHQISNSQIDNLYEKARKAGAIGGKLMGAGGGGFMLLFVEPERRESVRSALHPLVHVPFQFEATGSQVIHYQPDVRSEPLISLTSLRLQA